MAASLVNPDSKFPVPKQHNFTPKLKYGYLFHTTRTLKITIPK